VRPGRLTDSHRESEQGAGHHGHTVSRAPSPWCSMAGDAMPMLFDGAFLERGACMQVLLAVCSDTWSSLLSTNLINEYGVLRFNELFENLPKTTRKLKKRRLKIMSKAFAAEKAQKLKDMQKDLYEELVI